MQDTQENRAEGSDGDSTDENRKRRREEDTEAGSFRRSKKTLRSPVKSKPRKETEDTTDMERLEKMMHEIMGQLKEIRKENQEYKEDLKELKKENLGLKKENQEIRKDLQELELKVEKWERKQRENNIVITGIEIQGENEELLKEKLEEFIKNYLNVEVKFNKAYKIKNKPMYVGEVACFQKKLKIMEKKSCLKEIKEKRIYISSDYTKKEREIQKNIRDRADKEQRQGNRVKIGYQRITINGKLWIWDDKTKSLEENKNGEVSKN